MTINWVCAKSGKDLTNQLVHLYLPGGQRITGIFDGARYLMIVTAHRAGHSSHVSTQIAPEKLAVCRKAGTDSMDTFMAVAGSPVGAELWNTRELAEGLVGEYKVVLDRFFSSGDTYASLQASNLTHLPLQVAA
ncbi:hypothetical protein [Marinobacter sp. MBR-105]